MSRASVAGLGAAGVRRLLGDGFTHDLPGRITGRLDVDVWVLDLTGDAYSIVADGRRVIVAKRTPNWFRQNFSIATRAAGLVLIGSWYLAQLSLTGLYSRPVDFLS